MIGKTGKRNNRCSVHRVYMGGRALHEANEVINVSREQETNAFSWEF